MTDILTIKKTIAPIARSYGVKKIYLFGSYAKGNANENSDIDLLVEKGKPMSLLKLPFVAKVLNPLDKTDATNSLVVVLPTLPVRPTTGILKRLL